MFYRYSKMHKYNLFKYTVLILCIVLWMNTWYRLTDCCVLPWEDYFCSSQHSLVAHNSLCLSWWVWAHQQQQHIILSIIVLVQFRLKQLCLWDFMGVVSDRNRRYSVTANFLTSSGSYNPSSSLPKWFLRTDS